MKQNILKLVQKILKVLAQKTLKRYNPQIIGITGTVGKTSTRNAIYAVLSTQKGMKVRTAKGSFNNELGLPLTILGNYKESGGASFWFKTLFKETSKFILSRSSKDYPNILILEYGADRPGDIQKLIDIARPTTAVITAIGEIPVHMEFYDSVEEVAYEKSTLARSLKEREIAVLNADDPQVSAMASQVSVKSITFGFDPSANVQITDFENRTHDNKPVGISFTIKAYGDTADIVLSNVLGKPHAYAAAAAAAVGITAGMRLDEIKTALDFYKGEPGREHIVPGIVGSTIIDDSYNASPTATSSALETLKTLMASRKIAVLGEMSELGDKSKEAHERIGREVSSVADYIITVGVRAQFIADTARETGFPPERIMSFDLSTDAVENVKELIRAGDLILVKGSQVMRMERIVKAIMAEPSNAKRLLARQYGHWLKG